MSNTADLHPCLQNIDRPLSDEWLKAAGFKWHQFERQTDKHWLLWIGSATGKDGFSCHEDLGIEVAPNAWRPSTGERDGWFCWVRSDAAHRYHRFIHIRTLVTVRDLLVLICGLTGVEFDPALCRYGMLHTPERAEHFRRDDERLDRQLMRTGHPWSDVEKDDSRGGALPEHMEAAVKAGVAK